MRTETARSGGRSSVRRRDVRDASIVSGWFFIFLADVYFSKVGFIGVLGRESRCGCGLYFFFGFKDPCAIDKRGWMGEMRRGGVFCMCSFGVWCGGWRLVRVAQQNTTCIHCSAVNCHNFTVEHNDLVVD